ncbi:MAG: hypothetical protein ACK4SN_05465 [Bellilinea sp.]
MTHSTALEQRQQKFVSAGLFGLLAASFGLNLYLLFLQPVGILSPRRLILAAAVGLILSGAVWLIIRRGGNPPADWWRRWVVEKRMWRAGLWLSAAIHLIYPAAPAQLFAPTVALEVEIQTLTGQPAEFRLVSLNNGMVDVSYKDIQLGGSAEIRAGSGIHFALERDAPAKFSWTGRGWRHLSLVFSSDQPLEILIRYDHREERLRFDEAQPQERKISLPAGGWLYYGLVKAAVLFLGAASLAVLAGLLRNSPLWEDE